MLLATAQLSIRDVNGHKQRVRAVLDSGSGVSFMTKACARLLRLPLQKTYIAPRGLGDTTLPPIRETVRTVIHHVGDPPRLPVTFLVVKHITASTPDRHLPREGWTHLAGLQLADPHYHRPGDIDLLLGADVHPFLHRPGYIPSYRKSPTAIETTLGWIMIGPFGTPSLPRRVHFHQSVVNNEGRSPPRRSRSPQARCLEPASPISLACSTPEAGSSAPTTSSTTAPPVLLNADNHAALAEAVAHLWELDRISSQPCLSAAEKQCEEIFTATTTRDDDGRYCVALPLTTPHLGQSYHAALGQFHRLEKRLNHQPDLYTAYHAFMQDYLDSGHMSPVTLPDYPKSTPYYIPHHPVHRADDPPTKIRVVFNASCRTSSGKSLNEILLTGPKLQADISALITRFRVRRFVFTADIRQMYRQITVRDDHRDYQRILWRFSPDEPVSTYRLNTVTYGVSSAPYLALRTIQQLANRVAEIQEVLPSSQWHHVSSESNPADCASRGLLPSELCSHPLWWTGPDWLREPPEHWPLGRMPHLSLPAAVVEEERALPIPTLLAAPTSLGLEAHFSTLPRLQRVVAYCRRFASNARTVADQRQHGALTNQELRSALRCIVVQVQSSALAAERLAAADPYTRSRLVRRLALFIDKDGILRVGGRLSAAPLAYAHRHPALLPKSHPFTDLVIDNAHLRNLHSGAQATHAFIRQSFWILDGRNVIRHRIAGCNRCFSCKPRPVIQPMGSLPASRISASAPFLRVGVDYAGPYNITTGRIRGARVTKAYICAFVCFATKAVHLELASDLTTMCFLAAYRRFAARRGHSAVICSDNGTNFVGAHREITALSQFLQSPDHRTTIADAAAAVGTTWEFIPPSAPHFGGLWEASVKSTKHHLRRVVGTQLLSYEEFATVLTQVEAVLNSRPICPLSSDPSDLETLTPGHFLIQRPLNQAPITDLPHMPNNRFARWQLVQRIRNDFWKRWQTEYLHTLQQRSKWLVPKVPIAMDTLVLLKDDNAPPLSWPKGRISRLFPGPDGIARVAEVRTISGILTRPLAKLCPLPSQ